MRTRLDSKDGLQIFVAKCQQLKLGVDSDKASFDDDCREQIQIFFLRYLNLQTVVLPNFYVSSQILTN